MQEEKLTDYLNAVREPEEMEDSGEEENDSLAFADSCIFKVNQSMSGVQYKAVSFEEFAEYINEGGHYSNKPCVLKFFGGLITEICLQSV